MRALSPILSCLLLGSLAAQGEVKIPAPARPSVDPDLKTEHWVAWPKPADAPVQTSVATPGPRQSEAKQAIQIGEKRVQPTADPETVLFDMPGDGRVWGGSRAYKASFEGSGATFIPFFGATAPRNFPVAFTLRALCSGGQAVAFKTDGQARVEGQRVTIPRGTVDEVYELMPKGMEQLFVFASLPSRNDLVVQIGVTTELQFSRDGDGFRFSNDLGQVRYGAAVVKDAAGRQVAIESRYDDGAIELRVPASFLGGATFPVTIDPVINSFTAQSATTVDIVPDVAYDLNENRYLVVWEEAFSATDHDIYSALHNADGSQVAGSLAYLDRTNDFWARPRVANLRIPHRFLMVAERGLSPARQIWGRTRDAAMPAVLGAQFRVDTSGGSGDHFNADVGGDANALAPTYWTVVWERTLTPADSDIHGQQVNGDSTLNGSLLLIDNSGGSIDTHPGISKSDGDTPSTSQDWTIVFQRRFSPTDEDIRYARVHWNGGISTPSTALNSSTRSDTNPVVSSPSDSDSNRQWLAVYEGAVSGTDHNLIGTLGRGANPILSLDLTLLENAFPSRDQLQPHVDSDGCRFVVTYAELFSGTDWDILASTFHVVFGNALGVSDAHVGFGRIVRPELRPRITSTRSGGGNGVRYVGVWDDQFGISPLDIDIKGAVYDGRTAGGGLTLQPTGCNGVSMAAAGSPAVGETVTFTMTGVGANIPILMFGLPFGPAVVCPPCALGVDLGSASLFVTGTLGVPIPCEGAYIGGSVAIQGLTFGAGNCIGQVNLSDTYLMTIQ